MVLKGGSSYRPAYTPGSPPANRITKNWYYPPLSRVDEHNVAFLMADSFERAGTVGFRCAQDVEGHV